MVYTVKKLSEISGVTVRTLHFYEEIGLLKPSFYGENGYRYYEENELLQLQQESKKLEAKERDIEEKLKDIVQRESALARSEARDVVSELSRANDRANLADARLEFLAGFARAGPLGAVAGRLEVQIFEIDDRRRHDAPLSRPPWRRVV